MTGAVHDQAGVEALAAELAATLPAHAVLWLEGPLGAGKTTFARAFVAARGGGDAAHSPTYGLLHRYRGTRGEIVHLDCYRLRDPEEAAAIDWESALAADALLIEWPDRAGAWAPSPLVRVSLDHQDEATRTVTVQR
ncbi:MAG TPA: tRNA (adenosine(37)-N6)-threonylcarbamoyltransferase complex ATPase subunit type 1 TsaE [Gemmatimonadales bacterium]|nr:tRNA (adenosine(37)-N6)-threonylcarbamoyltransferase complex ATPase subunit type 1 TsaE [Gemmatimonadales bacterium]